MNLTDREILIITEYVDGSPSKENIIAAKELIKSNTDAERFESELRTSRAALISEANSKKNTNAIDRLMEVFDKPKKNSLLEFFLDLMSFGNREKISFSQIGGGAFAGVAFSTAFAFFMAPNIFLPANIDGNWNEYDFKDGQQIIMNKINLRSETLSSESLESSLMDTLDKMINERNINGLLIDGGNQFEIIILNIFRNSNCYEGKILKTKIEKRFLYCLDEKNLDFN